MRLPVGLILGLLLGVSPVAGCGPAIPPKDLGTVLEEVPEVNDAEEPYQLPQSGSPPAAGAETPES